MDGLTAAQRRALTHVAGRTERRPAADGADGADPAHRVTLNFHPDRGDLLDALAEHGRYLSQFVTGTGNGGLTAHPGGDRWRWESRLFGAAYDAVTPDQRPVYGALDRRALPVGAAPRFGSAHLRLAASVLARTTFCWPDSVTEPEHVAVAGGAGHLVALADAHPPDDPLDDYVEAQVHGPVRIPEDVEALVLDPCFRGTAVERSARRLGVPVVRHPGLVLDAGALDPAYRGAAVAELGKEIAGADRRLDARVVGDAVRAGRHDPQQLKRVWHHLAAFGVPSGVALPEAGARGTGR